jgi:hypothetical protein
LWDGINSFLLKTFNDEMEKADLISSHLISIKGTFFIVLLEYLSKAQSSKEESKK